MSIIYQMTMCTYMLIRYLRIKYFIFKDKIKKLHGWDLSAIYEI